MVILKPVLNFKEKSFYQTHYLLEFNLSMGKKGVPVSLRARQIIIEGTICCIFYSFFLLYPNFKSSQK